MEVMMASMSARISITTMMLCTSGPPLSIPAMALATPMPE